MRVNLPKSILLLWLCIIGKPKAILLYSRLFLSIMLVLNSAGVLKLPGQAAMALRQVNKG